jgi:hypothetical protein
MKGLPWFALSAGAVALMVGCSEIPQDVIDGARAELDEARSRGLAEYAPTEMQQAEAAWAALAAELTQQEAKSGLMRSYNVTREKADDVREAVGAARETATRARAEAETMARASVQEARASLEQARILASDLPRTKGAKVDPGMAFQPAIAAAEAQVAASESLLAAESFRQAQEAAASAKEAIAALVEDLRGASAQRT